MSLIDSKFGDFVNEDIYKLSGDIYKLSGDIIQIKANIYYQYLAESEAIRLYTKAFNYYTFAG